jgi:hypothetical protein
MRVRAARSFHERFHVEQSAKSLALVLAEK